MRPKDVILLPQLFEKATDDELALFRNASELVSGMESPETTHGKSKRRTSRSSGLEGGTNIGGLGERSLHLILKYLFEPDRDHHEVGILGRYYADIYRDGEVIEIQTRGFSSFRKKISAFSEVMPVTVVHPIVAEKTLTWIDPNGGEMSGSRKSPKKENIFGVFREVYALRELLSRDNIHFVFPVLKCSEFKLACGWSADGKKGSVRIERIPTELIGYYRFKSGADLAKLLPDDIQTPDALFTVAELSKLLSIPYKTAYHLISTLVFAGVCELAGKDGRKNLYRYIAKEKTI